MKFVATKEALSDKLSLCSAIAEKRQTIPILSNVLIKAEKQHITVIATDLERQLSLKINDCEVLEEGENYSLCQKAL
jgi:DNA polymerase-3 subunit beta